MPMGVMANTIQPAAVPWIGEWHCQTNDPQSLFPVEVQDPQTTLNSHQMAEMTGTFTYDPNGYYDTRGNYGPEANYSSVGNYYTPKTSFRALTMPEFTPMGTVANTIQPATVCWTGEWHRQPNDYANFISCSSSRSTDHTQRPSNAARSFKWTVLFGLRLDPVSSSYLIRIEQC